MDQQAKEQSRDSELKHVRSTQTLSEKQRQYQDVRLHCINYIAEALILIGRAM